MNSKLYLHYKNNNNKNNNNNNNNNNNKDNIEQGKGKFRVL